MNDSKDAAEQSPRHLFATAQKAAPQKKVLLFPLL